MQSGREKPGRGRRRTRCAAAGYVLPPDNSRKLDRELLADLRAVARRMRTRILTTTLYHGRGCVHTATIISRFGSWNAAVARAGLRTRWHRYSIEELMLNIAALWDALGRAPVRDDLSRPPSHISCSPYLRRFGRFRQALVEFVRWADSPKGQRALARRRRGMRHRGRPERATRLRTGRRGAGARPRRCRVRRIPVSRRFVVLKLDRFRCRACGRSPASDAGVELQVDHIRPIARGGSDALGNLQTLCKQCNSGKGARGH